MTLLGKSRPWMPRAAGWLIGTLAAFGIGSLYDVNPETVELVTTMVSAALAGYFGTHRAFSARTNPADAAAADLASVMAELQRYRTRHGPLDEPETTAKPPG